MNQLGNYSEFDNLLPVSVT